MKSLITIIALPFLIAAKTIDIAPPAHYSNGDEFTLDLFAKYIICARLKDSENECDETIEVTSNSISMNDLPEGTDLVKAKVVDNEGAESEWSNVIDELDVLPLPPNISIRIIVDIQ